jgi:hypothetical protein
MQRCIELKTAKLNIAEYPQTYSKEMDDMLSETDMEKARPLDWRWSLQALRRGMT